MFYCKYCYRLLEDGVEICPSCKKSQLVEKKQLKVLLGMLPIYSKYTGEAQTHFRKTSASYEYALESATIADFLERWNLFVQNAAILRTYEGVVSDSTFCQFSAILSKDSDAEFQHCLQGTVGRAKQTIIKVIREEKMSDAEPKVISFYEDLEKLAEYGSFETSQVSLSAMYEVAEVAGIDLQSTTKLEETLLEDNLPSEQDITTELSSNVNSHMETDIPCENEVITQGSAHYSETSTGLANSKPDIMEFAHNQLDYFAKYGGIEAELLSIDLMEGHDFEHWCADALQDIGYENVKVTPGSGDQGVDILAEKDGLLYAIQCKRYSSDLGNGPVQEVHAGKYMYHCHVAAVITNQHFTSGAKKLAAATGVLLWDREWITRYLQSKINDDGSLILNRTSLEPNVPFYSSHMRSNGLSDNEQFVLAVEIILETGQASVSMLQRRLKCGYALAASLIDKMEEEGFIGPFHGSTPRTILLTKELWNSLRSSYE